MNSSNNRSSYLELPDFESLKTVHIVGVCGTLMGSFAAFLRRRGIRVTGSDQNVYPPMSDVLKAAGVELLNGYSETHLTHTGSKPDLVVIGNVIGKANPEAHAALTGGYVYSSLPEAMEKLLLQKTLNLVVAGTHGKTTTSSLLAHTLVQCGKNPNYFIGGVSHDLPFSFHLSSQEAGTPFVLEGDEYDTAFWDKVPKFNHYLPDHAILTSVEFDHADIYPDFQAVVRAFEGLLDRIRKNGRLIACFDYDSVKKLIHNVRGDIRVISYGSSEKTGARYFPKKISMAPDMTHFEIYDSDLEKSVAEVSMRISGVHNILNALSVWIECHELGIPVDQISGALKSFQGVKRRQEVRGEVQGVLVIDDFAHHPTAVRETLKALRAKYPDRRLVAVFEPRSATSRRKVFQNEYAAAFQGASVVHIAAPYDQSKIDSSDQFSSDQLVRDICKKGQMGFLMKDVESGVESIARDAKSGDLVAVLSNGGFGGFIPKLLEMLRKK
ncbi:MAG: UDP-N-acetylmuramate dehydrogenase [Bdellovibrio sp.]|nr:UDP-N-acetylmuramate dehydrogenase [Bdellovibrio sp.]